MELINLTKYNIEMLFIDFELNKSVRSYNLSRFGGVSLARRIDEDFKTKDYEIWKKLIEKQLYGINQELVIYDYSNKIDNKNNKENNEKINRINIATYQKMILFCNKWFEEILFNGDYDHEMRSIENRLKCINDLFIIYSNFWNSENFLCPFFDFFHVDSTKLHCEIENKRFSFFQI